MSLLLRRQSNVFTTSAANNLQPGESYTVTAYAPGAVVSGTPTFTAGTVTTVGGVITVTPGYTSIPVYQGHGFAANNLAMKALDTSLYNICTATTSTTVTLTGDWSTLVAGDTIINLGSDTGTTSPAYDGSTVLVYSTPDTTTTISQSRVTVAEDGEYGYWHTGNALWEVVRNTSGTAVDYTVDQGLASVELEARYVHRYAAGGDGTSANPWVTWESAFSNIPSSGTTIIFAKGYYTKNGTISLPVNLTGWLRIYGQGGAVIKLTSTTPGLFGIASHSDYDTFQKVHIEAIHIDGNSIAGNTSAGSPVLIGTYGGTLNRRLNYANIVIRDITMTGVSDTGRNIGIGLQTSHPASGETATSCTDILIENVFQLGGQSGIVLTAGCDDATKGTTHTFERITIKNHRFKRGTVPTALAGAAGVQLGQDAIIKDCLVEGCQWENVQDVGIEVDNSYNVTVRDCTAINCFGYGFLATNFNTGLDVAKVEALFHGCRVLLTTGLANNSNTFFGYGCSGGSAALAGSATFRDCYFENLNDFVQRPFVIDGYVRRAVVDGFRVYAPNMTGQEAVYESLFRWINYYVGSVNCCRNVHLDLTQDCGSTNSLFVCFQFEMATARLEVENIVVKATLTNPGATVYFAAIDSMQSSSGSLPQNINGYIRGLKVQSVTGGVAASTVGVKFRQYLSSSSNIIVEQCDLSGMPANSSYLSIDAVADQTCVMLRDNITGSNGYRPGLAGSIPRNVGTWPINTATDGNDTACSNGTAYCGSIYIPQTMTITGVQYLVGSSGGTDKVIASLHNSSGTLLANSDTAGVTVGTPAQLQQVAFTATYIAPPGWYFLALTFNGTTAKFRSIPAYCNVGSGVIGNGVTQTFGTPANFTAPTTFTANTVPVASLY